MPGLGAGRGVDAEDPARSAMDAARVAAIGGDEDRAAGDREPLRVVAGVEAGHPDAHADRRRVRHRADRLRPIAGRRRRRSAGAGARPPARGRNRRQPPSSDQRQRRRRRRRAPHRRAVRIGLSRARQRQGRRQGRRGDHARRRRKASCAASATASPSRARSSGAEALRGSPDRAAVDRSPDPGQAPVDAEIEDRAKGSAAPTDCPIMRMNICEPVPMPRSCNPTLAWIATRKVGVAEPHADPDHKRAPAAANRQRLAGSSSVSMTTPPVTSATPPIAAVSR